MSLNITSKHMEITSAIKQHIEERLNKLKKWQTQLINSHFILNKEPNGFSVDVIIDTPIGKLVANAKHDDMYIAINDVTNKLERQLNKAAHKNEARRAVTPKNIASETEALHKDENNDIELTFSET